MVASGTTRPALAIGVTAPWMMKSISPATSALTASMEPRKGTCSTEMPVSSASVAPYTCPADASPAEPRDSFPGFFFACSTNCAKFLTGKDSRTAMTARYSATPPMKSKLCRRVAELADIGQQCEARSITEQQRVAVRRRLGDKLGADLRGGPGLVVDDDRRIPAQRLDQAIGHEPAQDVGRAAGRIRHHHVDRMRRPRILRLGRPTD